LRHPKPEGPNENPATMSEEPDNAAPEKTPPAATPAPDVPAAESEAAPPAETDAERTAEPAAAEDETPDMPDFFAKIQAKIPDKLVPPTIKMDGRIARKAAFWITLVGSVLATSVAQVGEMGRGIGVEDFKGGAVGYLGSAVCLVGLWFSLVAIKRIKRLSKELAVCVVVVAVVALSSVFTGCGAASIRSKFAAIETGKEAAKAENAKILEKLSGKTVSDETGK
jgi:hypothetical protein